MNSLIETAHGHLVGADGAILSRHSAEFSADTVAILRAYFTWAMRNHLEPEFICAACDDHSRESKAQYAIDEQKIVIVCACSIRHFEGFTPAPKALAPSLSAPVDATGPIVMVLSLDAARLLRQYKKAVLMGSGLKEAVRCNACYELGMADGCDASVTDSAIRIDCRCTKRRFTGSSL